MPQRPKIVLVGQLVTAPWVFEAAQRVGVDVVLIPWTGTDLDVARRAAAVTEVLPLDVETDPDGALAALVERFRSDPFDGIMAGNELVVPFTARAARTLGLPGLSEQGAAVVRDKRSMRQRLAEAGLAVPGLAALERKEDWADALTLRFPVVVKPARGFSSLGVIRVDDKEQLEQAVSSTWELVEARSHKPAETGGGSGVLVEEYLDGPEISAESLVHRGRVRVCAVSWKGELTGPYFEETTLRAPARLPAEILAAVEAEVVAAHHAFGVDEGATHTELRLVGGVRPVLLEMGARIGGGGFMHHLVRGSSGIDFAGETVRIHLGQEPRCWSQEPVAAGHAAAYLVPVGTGGTFRRIRGLDEVRADPRVDHVAQAVAPGAVLRPYPAWTAYPAIVLSHHASDEEAVQFREHLERTLHIEYEEQG
ncbi:ATP-grasp domain-containing protein [Streptomyces sp. RP5T]|uniref:ATP-grasp domain-containing protein n=1 Tax=Streptomyces sp. RP5T TaxID=2490848 RepID=UPI000F6471F0|nr:ATP-grasp domain-containing protein [Streptomyces sp. RP5T]RRR84876.1 ATP-grasp domain-containing protein [Streptomyces sp. RP5T]